MTNKFLSTLFLTRELPYPPMGGVALRNWQNINIMIKFGSVAVFSIPSGGWKPQDENPPGVTLWNNYQIGDIANERSLGRKIQDRLWWLQPRRHPWANQLYGDRVIRDLEQVFLKFQPHLVIFEELWLYRYLKRVKRYGCHTIYDAHNVEACLRQEMHKSLQGQELKATVESRLLLRQVKSIECDFVRQVDQLWVCSENDANLFQKLYGTGLPIHVVANGVNVTDYESVRLSSSSLLPGLEPNPWTLVFTATFTHQPNRVAVQILIDQIYPQLRNIYPQCRLILVGRSPTPYMKEAAKRNSSIQVTGTVPDIRPYLAAASVVIVPLFEGGGTRLKILEAFAASRPVVSTTKGAEGLSVRDGEHLLIRDTIEGLVAGVCQLWSDPSVGQKLADSAYQLVQSKYSWEAVGRRVEKSIQELLLREVQR